MFDDEYEKLLLQAYRQGVKNAITLSEKTGVPLAVQINGKIKQIKPKYKYVRVPIEPKKRKVRD